MILSIILSAFLVEISFRLPQTTTFVEILIECENGFIAHSGFPATRGAGARKIRGEMGGWCETTLIAINSNRKIIDKDSRRFYILEKISGE